MLGVRIIFEFLVSGDVLSNEARKKRLRQLIKTRNDVSTSPVTFEAAGKRSKLICVYKMKTQFATPGCREEAHGCASFSCDAAERDGWKQVRSRG